MRKRLIGGKINHQWKFKTRVHCCSFCVCLSLSKAYSLLGFHSPDLIPRVLTGEGRERALGTTLRFLIGNQLFFSFPRSRRDEKSSLFMSTNKYSASERRSFLSNGFEFRRNRINLSWLTGETLMYLSSLYTSRASPKSATFTT